MESIKVSSKRQVSDFLLRFAGILTNWAILFTLLSLTGVASFLVIVLIMLVFIIAIIVTLGTIFVIVPNFFDLVQNATAFTATISEFIFSNMTAFCVTAISLTMVSFIILISLKGKSRTLYFVLNALFFTLSLGLLLLSLSGFIK